jgi:hypothetical protein
MCTILQTEDGPIETIGELQHRWGNLVLDQRYGAIDDFAPYCCLCPVDMVASATKARRVIEITAEGDWQERMEAA